MKQLLPKSMELPDVDINVRLNTTTMRPKESIQVCIEEKVPLFCAGLGNPGFMQVSVLIDEIKLAAQILEEMIEETVEILTQKLPANVIAK